MKCETKILSEKDKLVIICVDYHKGRQKSL